LIADELVEIGIGEHAAGALGAVTNHDAAQRATLDVAPDGLDRAAELGGHLALGAKAVRQRNARYAAAATLAHYLRHVGALDSAQNSGDLRHFVSHRSRTRCDHLDAG
jgi:hypothetical protein